MEWLKLLATIWVVGIILVLLFFRGRPKKTKQEELEDFKEQMEAINGCSCKTKS